MNTLNIRQVAELGATDRQTIIQNLWNPINPSDLPWELSKLPWPIQWDIQRILQYASQIPTDIPTIRYELETYTNDLDPDFLDNFLESNRWKVVRLLDIWAGPGDVTIRAYQTLISEGLTPQIYALEGSSRFRWDITEAAQSLWIDTQEVSEIWLPDTQSWIYPIAGDIRKLQKQKLWTVDLLMWNYVLDRVPQKSLMRILEESGISYVQFINCVPLQYQNPNTWQSYIPENEIIIPEWAWDLSAVWDALQLNNREEFYGTNTVTSLQDGPELFEYAWMRWQQ